MINWIIYPFCTPNAILNQELVWFCEIQKLSIINNFRSSTKRRILDIQKISGRVSFSISKYCKVSLNYTLKQLPEFLFFNAVDCKSEYLISKLVLTFGEVKKKWASFLFDWSQNLYYISMCLTISRITHLLSTNSCCIFVMSQLIKITFEPSNNFSRTSKSRDNA